MLGLLEVPEGEQLALLFLHHTQQELVKGFKEKHESVGGKTDPLDTRTVLTAVWFWEERSHRLMPSGPQDADEQRTLSGKS